MMYHTTVSEAGLVCNMTAVIKNSALHTAGRGAGKVVHEELTASDSDYLQNRITQIMYSVCTKSRQVLRTYIRHSDTVVYCAYLYNINVQLCLCMWTFATTIASADDAITPILINMAHSGRNKNKCTGSIQLYIVYYRNCLPCKSWIRPFVLVYCLCICFCSYQNVPC